MGHDRRRQRHHPNSDYSKFSHATRINLIYENRVHGVAMRQMAHLTGINYNSIRNIIVAYETTGRTNKKMSRAPPHAGVRALN